MIIYLADIQGYNPVTLQVETLRFCTGTGYIEGNNTYEPRLKQAGSIKAEMFQTGQFGGSAPITYGEVTVSNIDGELDYLINWSFDGRTIQVRRVDDVTEYSEIIYKTTISQPVFEYNVISFRLRDKQFLLDKALQQFKFAGDNVLPEGLEGVPTDIKGKAKPLLFGKAYNVPLICVNTAKLIYAVNIRPPVMFDALPDVDSLPNFDLAASTGSIENGCKVTGAYDKGVSLTAGTPYANEGELLNNAPAGGTYRVWEAGGYVRLGAVPIGTPTADCQDVLSNTEGATIGKLTQQILAQLNYPSNEIAINDLDNLDSDNPLPMGLYIADDTKGPGGLNILYQSALTWWGFDRLGIFRAQQIILPLINPVLNLNEEILECECLSTVNTDNGVPAKQVKLRWRKNYQVQQVSDLASSVSLDRKNELSQEYRETLEKDDSILERHLLASDLVVDTAFYDEPVAETLRQLNIFKTKTLRLRLKIKFVEGFENLLNLSTIINITYYRFNLQNGKNMMIVGYELDLETNNIQLIVWG